MRTVGMGVKRENPDEKLRAELEAQSERNAELSAENAKLRAELEAQIEHNADLMAENTKLRAELEELKASNEGKTEQTGRKKSQ